MRILYLCGHVAPSPALRWSYSRVMLQGILFIVDSPSSTSSVTVDMHTRRRDIRHVTNSPLYLDGVVCWRRRPLRRPRPEISFLKRPRIMQIRISIMAHNGRGFRRGFLAGGAFGARCFCTTVRTSFCPRGV